MWSCRLRAIRFLVFLTSVDSVDVAEQLGDRISLAVAHPSVVVDGVAEVTASIGVAMGSPADPSLDPLVRRAVGACGRARAAGGARMEVAAAVAPSTSRAQELGDAIAPE